MKSTSRGSIGNGAPRVVRELMRGLEGKTVVVTRARAQAGELTRLLEERGARPLVIPTIEIVEPESWDEADRAIDRLGRYHWVILTSVNGVKFFLGRLRDDPGGLAALAGRKICAVGPRTREALLREGLHVDFMPSEHVAEAIVEQAGADNWKGKKVLLARAAEGRAVIPDRLRQLGAEVEVVAVYRNVRPKVSRDEFRRTLGRGEVDAITFTSASTVRNFAGLFPDGEAVALLEGVAVACIGPVTAAAARELGLEVQIMPGVYTIPALTEALEAYFETKS